MKKVFSGNNNFILSFYEPQSILLRNQVVRINKLKIGNKIFSGTEHFFVFLKSKSNYKIYFHQDSLTSEKFYNYETFISYLKEYGFEDEEIFKTIESLVEEAYSFIV